MAEWLACRACSQDESGLEFRFQLSCMEFAMFLPCLVFFFSPNTPASSCMSNTRMGCRVGAIAWFPDKETPSKILL